MAILFFCIVFQTVILWQHFLMFLGFKNLFLGSLHSKPQWQYFIFFLDLYINIFLGSLHSKPLHGLELTSFSTIPGNTCCHGNPFLLFLGLIKNFMGSLPSITLHRLELISFSAIPGSNCCHGNTFLLFLGPIYKYFCGFFAFHTPTHIGTA